MIVYFIYCQECVDCRNMKKIVLKTLQSLNVEFEFNEFDCETDEAVDIAIEYKADDIPVCIFMNDDKTKIKTYSGPRSCQKADVKFAVEYIESKDD